MSNFDGIYLEKKYGVRTSYKYGPLAVILCVDVDAVGVGVDERADDLVPAHPARRQQEGRLVCRSVQIHAF